MTPKQPSIFLFGVQIDEPVTALTALFISFVCFYAFIKLAALSEKKPVDLLLTYYFLVMALATANGSIIGHAFLYHFSFSWKLIGWILSMVSIMLVERASIEYTSHLIGSAWTKFLKWINLIELSIFVTLTIVSLKFFFVELHTTYGLLIVVASLHLFIFIKEKSEGSRMFLIAVGFSAISALIYINKWDISKWFNHSDISHMVLVITAWFFYLGARKIAMEHTKFKI